MTATLTAPLRPRGRGGRPVIELAGVGKAYETGSITVDALRDVDLRIDRGEFVAIVGPSGSGKSTLMHILGCLDVPTAGRYDLAGEDVAQMHEAQLAEVRNRLIGFVFQQFNLLPTLTARENITFPLDLAGRSPDPAWMDQVVATVGLGDRLDHKPSELSGGQQQRVAVARALVERPQIIFADEPTGNLDSRSSAEILTFMARAVAEQGQTVVMVTHDPVAASYAGRILFLADGRIVDELLAPTRESILARMGALGI